MKRFVLCALCVLLAAAFAAPSKQPEWERKPIEIITGDLPRPHYPTVWSAQKNGVDSLVVEGKGKLELSGDFCLWNDKSAKLTFTATPATVTLKPKSIVFQKKIDAIELWVYGFKSGKPRNSFVIRDAKGKLYKLRTRGNSSYWAKTPWWCTTTTRIPKQAVFPVTLEKIIFEATDKIKAGDAMYFDFLGAVTLKSANLPDTAQTMAPFPYDPASILPTPSARRFRTDARAEGKTYLFTFQGDGTTVEYAYTPKNGTLGDLAVSLNGGRPFQPMLGGGVVAGMTGQGARIHPADAAVKATLLKCDFQHGKVTADWRLEKDGLRVEYTLGLELQRGSLAITATSKGRDIVSFSAGRTLGTPTPRLLKLSYLNYRWDYPRILATDDYFVSVFPDWYTSHASEVADSRSAYGLVGARVVDNNSAHILGGSIYLPNGAGLRNPLHEHLFLTVSPEFDAVLPNIPNPRSRFFDETKTLVYCTRQYATIEARQIQKEIDFWRLLADYGARDMFVRFHSDVLRTPLRNNHFTHYDRAYDAVGDANYQRLCAELRKILRRVGVYEDNRVSHPLGPEFTYDEMAQHADGSFIEGWDSSYQPSPAAQHRIEANYAPKIIAKFGWNACYFDEVTNTPPWGMVDYNPDIPGSATYLNVLRNYAFVAQKLSEYYNGPIWSEGNAAFFWAGYLDTDYAQTNAPDDLPVVDFKLRKVNPHENLNGPDLRKMSVDNLLSAEIAFGNMGHLWADAPGMPKFGQNLLDRAKPEDMRQICRSYFMVRQLQEYYAGGDVRLIQYQCGKDLLTATQMFRQNRKNEGKVHIAYNNGLELWVNRSPDTNWEVTVEGKAMVLPPYGYAASLPGTLLEYSALVDGHRADYSRGPLYTYLDGRGTRTAFPELTAANAYVIFPDGKARTLTPVPFIAPEKLELPAVQTVTALDRADKPLPAPKLAVQGAKAAFETAKSAFRYRLQ